MRFGTTLLLFLLLGTFGLNCNSSQPRTKTPGKGQAAALFEEQRLFLGGDHNHASFRIPALVVSSNSVCTSLNTVSACRNETL